MADTITRPGSPSREAIIAALSRVDDPARPRAVTAWGMTKARDIGGGGGSRRLVLPTPACPVRRDFQELVETAVLAVPGVQNVRVVLGAEVRGSTPQQGKRP